MVPLLRSERSERAFLGLVKSGPFHRSIQVGVSFTSDAQFCREMAGWRMLLRLSAALCELVEIQAINSTSYAHRLSSRNYTKPVEGTFESIKITLSSTGVVETSSTYTVCDIFPTPPSSAAKS